MKLPIFIKKMKMESTFRTWETNRNIYLSFLENYNLEQLNTVPEGFSNNLIWNIGHIIAVQQGLVYSLSALPINISEEMKTTYQKGSYPTGNTTQAEVEEIKHLLISLIAKTKQDYADGKFISYNEYTTSTGFTLKSSEEAMEFNNYHEGIHLGCMLNIKKFI